MTTYTNLEKTVFNALIDICFSDCEADLKDIANNTELKECTIKGVVGSLVKKGLVATSDEERGGDSFNSINPIIDSDDFYGLLSYGREEFTEEEKEALKI